MRRAAGAPFAKTNEEPKVFKMTKTVKPVLIVMTNHRTKGDGGKPTGFYLSEVMHPLAVFDAAGIPVELVSIQRGEPPVDGLDLNDATNAKYWNDEKFRQAIRSTKRLTDVEPKHLAPIPPSFLQAAMEQCGTSRRARRSTRKPATSGNKEASWAQRAMVLWLS